MDPPDVAAEYFKHFSLSSKTSLLFMNQPCKRNEKVLLKDLLHVLLLTAGISLQIITAAPQKFKIDILPVDDGTPRIVTNLGLQWLEYMENKVGVLLLDGGVMELSRGWCC